MNRPFVARDGKLLGFANTDHTPDFLGHAMAALVKGFRTPASHWREGVHGGRRPKSLEGGNRGESASAALSGYGDLAPAFDLIFRSRVGTAGERALRRCCRSPGLRTER